MLQLPPGKKVTRREDFCVRIRNILKDDYPDGSYINEAIQNADDAGATDVRFVVSSKKFGNLDQKIDGNALYIYNNAVFREEDFGNILNMSNSLKKLDELVTGQYGLGSNSFHHVSDVLTICSHSTLMLLDPSTEYFGEEGIQYDFKEIEKFPIANTYKLFGCDMKNQFNATIFRFPFRQKPSAIWDEVPTLEKLIKKLQNAFNEAHEKLLFLKNIESISWYLWKDESEPVLQSKIYIKNLTDEVRKERRKLKGAEINVTVAKFSLEIVTQQIGDGDSNSKKENVSTWIIRNEFRETPKMRELKQTQKELKLVPWAGVALCASNKIVGRAFCTLPLPIQTGLPVHINAFFQITPSREGIYNSYDNSDKKEGIGKAKIDWNVELQKILGFIYLSLIEEQFKISDCEEYYARFPSANITETNPWKILIRSFFENSSNNKEIFLARADKKFYSNKGAIFIGNAPKSVVEVIDALHYGVIFEFNPYNAIDGASFITPSATRRWLKPFKKTEYFNHLDLLEYCLDDVKNESDLHGLCLLPVSNGEFVEIGKQSVYKIGGDTILFQNCPERIFNAKSINPLLEHKIGQFASKLKIENLNQKSFEDLLKLCYPALFPSLNSGPIYWNSSPTLPSEEWIRALWDFRSKYGFIIPNNMKAIPIANAKKLASIDDGYLIIGLSGKDKEIISKISERVVDDGYNVQITLKNEHLFKSIVESIEIEQIQNIDRDYLRKLLARLRSTFISNITFNRMLLFPIFQTYKDGFQSIRSEVLVTEIAVDKVFQQNIGDIIVFDESTRILVSKAGFTSLNSDEFFIEIISRLISLEDSIRREALKAILKSTQSSSVFSILQSTPIFPSISGTLKKPSELFAYKSNLRNLFPENFQNEHFIHKEFSEEEIPTISLLGLKKEPSLHDLKEIASYIEKTNSLDLANNFIKFLSQLGKRYDYSSLNDIKWMPISKKPLDYFLDWKGTETFASPSVLYPQSFSYHIGKSQLIVSKDVSKEVLELFGIANRVPQFQDIFIQLLHLSEKSSQFSPEQVTKVIRKIYTFLQDNLTKQPKLPNVLEGKAWIWNGTKFYTSEKVAFLNPIRRKETGHFSDLGTSSEYRTLFQAWGVNAQFPPEYFRKFLESFNGKVQEEDVEVVLDILGSDSYSFQSDSNSKRLILTDQNTLVDVKDETLVYYDREETEERPKEFKYIHPKINNPKAKELGVLPLSRRLQKKTPFRNKFGQRENITNRISEIIREYTAPNIFKEFAQNADDAKATEMIVIYDQRNHKTQNLLSKEIIELQGESILIYNNATFTQSDIESIQEIGIGGKREDNMKTGKFGLGFNVAYHFSDAPSFVTGDSVYMFDPHCKYIPDADNESPGGSFPISNWAKNFPNQLDPYILPIVGFKGESSLNATIFRIPLRRNLNSKISKKFWSKEEILGIIEEFGKEIEQTLLFLKNLQKIRFMVWKKGSEQPELMYEAHIEIEEAFQKKRIEMLKAVVANSTCKLQPLVYEVNLFHNEKNSKWLVCNSFGSDQAIALMNDETLKQTAIKLLPWGGAAIKLDSNSEVEVVKGRAFCFLPLPIETDLPFHVNGYFVLSKDRRNIWTSDSARDAQAQICWEWNKMVLKTLITPSIIAICSYYKELKNKEFFSIFPHLQTKAIWEEISSEFYRLVINENFFLVRGEWMIAQDIYFIDIVTPKEVVEALEKRNTRISHVEKRIPDAIKKVNSSGVEFITPKLVRSKLEFKIVKTFDYNKDFLKSSESLLTILEYASSDLGANDDYSALNKVALLPLEGNKYTCFDTEKEFFILNEEELKIFQHKVDSIIQHDIAFSFSKYSRKSFKFSSLNLKSFMYSLLYIFPPDWLKREYVRKEDFYKVVGEPWMKKVWKFFKSHWDTKFDDEKLRNIPIIPTKSGKVYPFREESKIFLISDDVNDSYHSLANKLIEYGLEELDVEAIWEHDIHHQTTMIPCLKRVKIGEDDLKTANEIVKYLAKGYYFFDKETNAEIKDLAIFETCDSRLVTINCFTQVAPAKVVAIPGVLKYKKKVIIFYEALGIKKMKVNELFIKHVIPNFPKFTQEQRKIILEILLDAKDLEDDFLVHLKRFEFIPNVDGTLKPVNYFVHDFILNELFPNHILPEPFNSDGWLSFCKKLDLETEVKESNVVKCAQQLASLLENQADRNVHELSKDFVFQVYEMKGLSSNTLRSLISIPFVPVITNYFKDASTSEPGVSKWKKQYHPFSKISTSEYLNLLCLQVPIIIKELEPRKDVHFLQMIKPNCKLVSDQLAELVKLNSSHIIKAAVEQCIEYLQSKIGTSEFNEVVPKLSSLNFIWDTNNKAYRNPSQVFLKTTDEIFNYIYKLPPDLERFTNFFKAIGVKETPTIESFNFALLSIFNRFEDKILLPNEIRSATDAIRGIFFLKMQNKALALPNPLYVLTSEGALLDSKHVVCVDVEATLASRINSSKVKRLREDLSMMVSVLEIRQLSTLLIEKIDPKTESSIIEDKRSEKLSAIICSPQFIEGIKRLLLNKAKKNNNNSSSNSILQKLKQISERIQDIKDFNIKVCSIIYSKLFFQSFEDSNSLVEITKSDDKCECLIDNEKKTIYVVGSNLVPAFAAKLNSYLGISSSGKLKIILDCSSPDEISSILDMHAIASSETDSPIPGQVVPQKWINYITNEYGNPKFEIGELIAWEFEPMQFRFGLIKSIEEKTGSLQYYNIEIDQSVFKKLSHNYIFKFMHSPPKSQENSDASKDEEEETADSSLPEMNHETKEESNSNSYTPLQESDKYESPDLIRKKLIEQLEDILKLPKDEQNQAFNRLKLKWHPDKNPKNVEVASEMFRIVVDFQQNKQSDFSKKNQEEWEFKFQRNTRREAPKAPPRFPKPQEATYWFKQAEYDFKAAESLFNNGFYEQAVFYCQQIAEKCLKGIILKVGIRTTDSLTHNLHYLYNLIQREETHFDLKSDFLSLDKWYTQTRYPNGAIPHNIVTRNIAEDAIKYAQYILLKTVN